MLSCTSPIEQICYATSYMWFLKQSLGTTRTNIFFRQSCENCRDQHHGEKMMLTRNSFVKSQNPEIYRLSAVNLLLCNLLRWRSSVQASSYRCKTWNCRFVQHLRAAYVQTVGQFAQQAIQAGLFFIFIWKLGPHWNKVSRWGLPESRGQDAGVPVPLWGNVDL